MTWHAIMALCVFLAAQRAVQGPTRSPLSPVALSRPCDHFPPAGIDGSCCAVPAGATPTAPGSGTVQTPPGAKVSSHLPPLTREKERRKEAPDHGERGIDGNRERAEHQIVRTWDRKERKGRKRERRRRSRAAHQTLCLINRATTPCFDALHQTG